MFSEQVCPALQFNGCRELPTLQAGSGAASELLSAAPRKLVSHQQPWQQALIAWVSRAEVLGRKAHAAKAGFPCCTDMRELLQGIGKC